MATGRDVGPRLGVRLTYLLERALVELEALHAEHLAPVGVSGRALGVLLLLDDAGSAQLRTLLTRLTRDRPES